MCDQYWHLHCQDHRTRPRPMSFRSGNMTSALLLDFYSPLGSKTLANGHAHQLKLAKPLQRQRWGGCVHHTSIGMTSAISGKNSSLTKWGKAHIQTYVFQIYFSMLNWGNSWSANKLRAVIWQQEYQICVWSQAIYSSISHFPSITSATRPAVWNLNYFVSQRKLKLDGLMHCSFSVFSFRALNWLMPSHYVDSFSMCLLIRIHL